MAFYMKTLMTILIFLVLSSWLIGQITGVSYALLSPVTLGAMVIELVIAVALGTTTIGVGNQLRNIAIGAFFGTLVLTMSLDLFFNSMPIVYGIVIVPIYLVLGFIFLEVGKS
jgi:hypothetical protein